MLDDRGPFVDTGPTLKALVRRGLHKAGRDLWYKAQRRPGKLIRYLQDGRLQPGIPVERERTIWKSSEPEWHRWSQRKFFSRDQVFVYDHWGPKGFSRDRNFLPRLEELIVEYQFADQTFDITDIEGMSASKSAEWKFDSIDEFATARCPRWIVDGSEQNFAKMLRHREICLHSMRVERMAWAQRGPYWLNSGGSHHMAAAIYLARAHGHRFSFQSVETRFEVNETVLRELDAHWEILITNRQSAFGDLRTALKGYQCSYGTTPVPRNLFEDGDKADIGWERGNRMTLVWLDKNDARAMTVAETMKNAGFVRFNPWLMSLAPSPSL